MIPINSVLFGLYVFSYQKPVDVAEIDHDTERSFTYRACLMCFCARSSSQILLLALLSVYPRLSFTELAPPAALMNPGHPASSHLLALQSICHYP